jgi:excinuclease UvrABC nuclease subunit
LFTAVYGPYTSGRSLKTALELVRKAIPWSVCTPPGDEVNAEVLALAKTQKTYGLRLGRNDGRPCFDAQISRCPGVCTGSIAARDYGVIIRRLARVFEGDLPAVAKELEKDMARASKAEQFEHAAQLRNQLYALTHIQDVALIMRDEPLLPVAPAVPQAGYIDLQGRIEAYDIANISGTASVAAMTVFMGGQPLKAAYRKFKIKTVVGTDDFASLAEVMRRRLARIKREPKAWPLPEIFIIDGGEGQVNRIREVLAEENIKVPVLGIAKGFDRKQDRLVFDQSNKELLRAAEVGKEIFQLARDEAHRFAGAYHRLVRAENSGLALGRKTKGKSKS